MVLVLTMTKKNMVVINLYYKTFSMTTVNSEIEINAPIAEFLNTTQTPITSRSHGPVTLSRNQKTCHAKKARRDQR